MENALYNPSTGYYQTLGRQGKLGTSDYITAPTSTPAFGHALAEAIKPYLIKHPHWSIAEYGPGDGQLSTAICQSLKRHRCYPRYFCIENAENKRAALTSMLDNHPDFCRTVVGECPPSFCGIIIANEVLDALPVHLISSDEACVLSELTVCMTEQNTHTWGHRPLPSTLQATFIDRNIPLFPNYRYEVSLAIPSFIHAMTTRLQEGLIFLIDYGYPRKTLYAPQRKHGTMTCYRQHQASFDPLSQVGDQDISCHIDFTLVAESLSAAGCQVHGLYPQGAFITYPDFHPPFNPFQALSMSEVLALKRVIHPGEMGSQCQIMVAGQHASWHLPQMPNSLDKL